MMAAGPKEEYIFCGCCHVTPIWHSETCACPSPFKTLPDLDSSLTNGALYFADPWNPEREEMGLAHCDSEGAQCPNATSGPFPE